MHQAVEIDVLHGFDRRKEKHIIWLLTKKIKLLREKSYTSDVKEQFLVLGRKSMAEDILAMLSHKPDWYCPNCGYLDPQEVTFDEKCDICGNKL